MLEKKFKICYCYIEIICGDDIMPNNRNFGYGFNKSDSSESGNENKPINQSKYLRKPGEKKTSKYVRDKNDTRPQSKYLRNKNEEREHHYNLARNYREDEEISEDITDEELDETQIAENETAETSDVESVENDVETSENDVVSEEPENADEVIDGENDELKSVEEYAKEHGGEETGKYSDEVANMFSHSKLSKETTVAQNGNEEEQRRKLIIMTVIVMVVLSVISYALFFAKIRLPHTPDMLNFELSIVPELIASLAYGPLFGILIIIIKTIVLLFTSDTAYATLFSGFILDSIFVFICGWFYSRRMFSLNPKKSLKPTSKDKRRGRIFIGGIIGSVVTTFISFFLTRFVSYPMLIWQYGEKFGVNNYYILENYQKGLDSLNTALPETISSTITKFTGLTQAILFYNVPLTLIKLFIITVATVVFYPIFSPYIHFRKNSK